MDDDYGSLRGSDDGAYDYDIRNDDSDPWETEYDDEGSGEEQWIDSGEWLDLLEQIDPSEYDITIGWEGDESYY